MRTTKKTLNKKLVHMVYGRPKSSGSFVFVGIIRGVNVATNAIIANRSITNKFFFFGFTIPVDYKVGIDIPPSILITCPVA